MTVSGPGEHRTQTEIVVVKETETTALLDGQHGMGHVIAYRAMRMAMDKARQYGMGAVAVRNSTHFGIAGYYPLMAAKEGMIGLTVTNARPSIAPTFGTEPMLGTNPIAFAAPSDMPYPFCLDMATSICQRGKIEVADRAEKPVPEGWVIDDEGQTDDRPAADPGDFGKADGRAAAPGRRGRGAGRVQGLWPGDDGRDPVRRALRRGLYEGPVGLCARMARCGPTGWAISSWPSTSSICSRWTSQADHRRDHARPARLAQGPGQERIYVAGEKE